MINYERFGFLCPVCDNWQYGYDHEKICQIIKTGNMYCRDCKREYEKVTMDEDEISYGIVDKDEYKK